MRTFNTRLLAIGAVSVAMVLVAACTTETEPAPPTPNIEATVAAIMASAPTPMPTPNIEATVSAIVATQVAGIPKPTPTPTSTPTSTPTATPDATSTPTATPTPAPRNTNLLHDQKETLNLAFTMSFRGTISNMDPYWWATDLAVTLRFRNAFGRCVHEIIISPNTGVLRPGDVADYEILAHRNLSTDWPDWLVTSPFSYYDLAVTSRWASPNEVTGLDFPREPTPIPDAPNDCWDR